MSGSSRGGAGAQDSLLRLLAAADDSARTTESATEAGTPTTAGNYNRQACQANKPPKPGFSGNSGGVEKNNIKMYSVQSLAG